MNISFAEYKALKGINASFLKACSFSAWHGWKYLNEPQFTSDAMEFGSAAHSALLEPETFQSMYAVSPKFDKRTKAGKEGAAEFESANFGKTVIDQDDAFKIGQIVANCKAIPAVAAALSAFEKEKTYTWDHPVGFKMKARLDLVDHKNGVIIDVKTTRNGEEREFLKQLLALRYDCQLLHYSFPLDTAATVYTIAIESDTAQVALYDVTDIVHSQFTLKRYEKALETAVQVLAMKECPPKFKPEIINLTLPKWALEETV